MEYCVASCGLDDRKISNASKMDGGIPDYTLPITLESQATIAPASEYKPGVITTTNYYVFSSISFTGTTAPVTYASH